MISKPERALTLPHHEVVARYVGGAHIDPATKQINGSAFERTVKDIDGVSFTRRGMFASDCETDRAAIRHVVGARIKLGATAEFVELSVSAALDVLYEFEQDVHFVADPLPAYRDAPPNPAHALLLGFPFRGEQVGSLKSEVAGDRLRSCVVHRFPAVATTS